MGVIAVDGGNSKTDLLAVTLRGEPLTWVRGPGSNAHAAGGAQACVALLGELVQAAGLPVPLQCGRFFLCGADSSEDVAELTRLIAARGWAREIAVDNDTFAVLRAGTPGPDAIAVVCGAGINCVGCTGDGRRSQHPALGWESGDWGGAESLGRRALFFAARGEDGRGQPTSLSARIAAHFELESASAVGWAIHRGTLVDTRLGELAGTVLELAGAGDAVAGRLVDALAREIVTLAERARRDLELTEAPLVLSGGMLHASGLLYERVVAALPAGLTPVPVEEPPITGAVMAALDAADAPPTAAAAVRDAVRRGLRPTILGTRVA